MKGFFKKGFGKFLSVAIRVAGDFAVFWLIFLWNDGVVWETLSTGAENAGIDEWFARIREVIPLLFGQIWGWLSGFLKTVWEWLVFLSPYSRQAAADPQFLYCLHWCSGCVALFVIIYICSMVAETNLNFLSCLLLSCLAGAAVWYACFGACFLIVKITVWFHVLAAIAAVVTSGIVGLLMLAFLAAKLNL